MSYNSYKEFLRAISGGYKQLLSNESFIHENLEYLLTFAAENGLNDILEAIRPLSENMGFLSFVFFRAFVFSCKHGHLETSRLIYNMCKSYLKYYQNNINFKIAILKAIQNKRDHILREFAPEFLRFYEGSLYMGERWIVTEVLQNNYLEGMKILHSLGVEMKDESYIKQATYFGYNEILEFLLEKCGANIGDESLPWDIQTPLRNIVLFKDFEGAYILTKHGVDLDSYGGKENNKLEQIKRYCDIRKRAEQRMWKIRANRVYYKLIDLIYRPGSECTKRLAMASYRASERGELL